MTPPNKLEELADFKDAIQSNKGLERLRAMQYLQQMNNQGLMGMPQVQQQPVVQRSKGGTTESELSAFAGLGHTVDNIRENLSTEDLATALSVGARGGSSNDRLIAQQIIGIFRQSNPEMVDEMFQAEQDEIDLEESEARKEMIEGVQNKVGGGLETIQDYLGARQGRAGGGPVINKFGGGFFKKFIGDAPSAVAPVSLAKQPVNDPIQNQGQAMPFIGGSGVAVPDPNISQEQAINNLRNMSGGFGGNSGLGSIAADMFETINSNRGSQRLANEVNYVEEPEENIVEQTMEIANADAMANNMPSFIFNNQEYQTGSMIPLRANTQGGIRERATEGGLINRDNNFVGNFQPNPNFVTPEEGLNQVAIGQPNMVEYTPPFIGGGMMPQPRMVPADEQGNPIMPISKQALSTGPFVNQPSTFSPLQQQPQVMKQLGSPNIQGFKSKQLAMEHASANQGGLVNVYQLGDGSWDYQRTGRPTAYPIGGAPGSPFAMAEGGYIIDPTGNIPTHPAFHGGPVVPRNQGGYVLDLAGGGSIDPAEAAQGLASFGRAGDTMLLHINPEELSTLASLGTLTRNPTTGLPEALSFGSVFRAIRNVGKSVAKGVKGIVKSKTFRALAPLVLAVAAPYALGALAPTVFGAGSAATMFGGALSTSGALGYGLATGLGSFAGNLLAGARPGDAARQGLMSGATAGVFKGFGSGNWMGTGTGGNVASQAGNVKQINAPKTILQAGTEPDAVAAPTTGGNPFANQMAATSAPIGENILTNVNAVPPNVGMTPDAYTGQGLQANQMMAATPGAVETVVPNQFSNVQFSPNVDVGVPPAPDATRASLFNSRLSNTGGSPVPGTGSTLDSIKQIGKDIYKDYGNWKGAAKLVGMDMMQPDWDAVYASEGAMEEQLANMGYTVDTGFDGQRVYRDSSGTVMPSNLTARDLLDRALGRTPRTRLADRIGFEPNATALAAKGGLVSLAGGGEFSGMVEGDGHGMQDNVYMPIIERGQGSQVGTLAVSPSEYVVDAHTMSALGNGNPDAGAKVMDNVIKSVRRKAYGTTEQPNQINGLNALMPMMQGV